MFITQKNKMLKRCLSALLSICIIFSSAYVGLSELDLSGLFEVKAKATSNIIINGVDIGYSHGSYFTKNGKSCSNSYWGNGKCHHNDVCEDSTHSQCNCMRYWPTGKKSDHEVDLKSVQCFGYSRYCQYAVYGCYDTQKPSYFTDITGVISSSNCTASNLKSKLLNCSPATHVRTSDSVKGYGHSISIVSTNEDKVIYTDCNSDGVCGVKKTTVTWAELASFLKSYGGVVYANAWNKDVIPTNAPVNLGEDFYGLIMNYDYWKPITLDYDTDENVRLREEAGSANQVWRFQRQDDGSYVISSSQNGKVLEFTNGKNEDSNIVSAHDEYWGGAYQKWLVFANEGGGYTIQSCHYESEGWYLTLDGNNSSNGTAITTCQATEDSSQVWGIYAGDEIQLRAPILVVGGDLPDGKATFSWENVYGATGYDLKIWKNEVNHDVEPYHIEWNVSSGFEMNLPFGIYEAYICSNNAHEFIGSDTVKFTVGEEGCSPIDLGEDFYGLILNYDYWKPITLDYDTDENVRLREEAGSANQVWRFQRQDDGSYVINSNQNGKVLEFTNGKNEDSNIVSAHDEYWGGAYQKWLVFANEGGGYTIRSCHYQSEGWYLTLDGNNSDDGTAITTCQSTGDSDQVWAIYKGDDVQLKAPVLIVDEGSCNEKTVFSWNRVYGSTGFDLKIWEDKVDFDVSPYHTEWGVSSGFAIDLPTGTYEVYVCSNNYYEYFGSDVVRFTVNADHNCSDEWIIDVVPTCIEEGSKSHRCTVCGEKADITVIAATGHNYEITDILSAHPHTTSYKCSYCEDEKTGNSVVADCIECIYGKNIPIKETENTKIDYDNFLIFTSVQNSDDILEILGVSETAIAIPMASVVHGGLEIYGTGTVITVFDGDDYIGDFTLIVNGDLNGDSTCDVLDAAAAHLYSVGLDEPNENEILAANCCISDEIDAASYQNVVNMCLAS